MNKKTVSIACLSISAIVVVSILGTLALAFGILSIVFGSMKANPVYQQAMEIIRKDPSVAQIFGSPVRDGFFVGGHVSSTLYGSGSADFSVAIRGPKASGNASIRGMKDEGKDWQVSGISIRVNGKPALIYNLKDQKFHPWQ
jgi:hypothetical protein